MDAGSNGRSLCSSLEMSNICSRGGVATLASKESVVPSGTWPRERRVMGIGGVETTWTRSNFQMSIHHILDAYVIGACTQQ